MKLKLSVSVNSGHCEMGLCMSTCSFLAYGFPVAIFWVLCSDQIVETGFLSQYVECCSL